MLKPLHDYVLCQAEEAETKTASGILIPDSAKEKPKVAKVLKVGEKCEQVKAGDRIIYKAYSTTEIRLDNEEFILVKEEDVLATVKATK